MEGSEFRSQGQDQIQKLESDQKEAAGACKDKKAASRTRLGWNMLEAQRAVQEVASGLLMWQGSSQAANLTGLADNVLVRQTTCI